MRNVTYEGELEVVETPYTEAPLKFWMDDPHWDTKKGLWVIRVYIQGYPKHIATFYDRRRAEEYVGIMNQY